MPRLQERQLGGEKVPQPGTPKPLHFELAAPSTHTSRHSQGTVVQGHLMMLQSDSLGLPCDARFRAVAMTKRTVYAYQSGRLIRAKGHQ